MPAYVECEKNQILAVAATICFQNATAKLCFQILNVAIPNRPNRRTKAEQDLIQGGIAPKPPVRSVIGRYCRRYLRSTTFGLRFPTWPPPCCSLIQAEVDQVCFLSGQTTKYCANV
jgi:hypothetical protein